MEMVETTPVLSLLAIVLLGVWGFIGGPTVLLPAFLMYFTISTETPSSPITEDAVSVEVQRIDVLTPPPIIVP